MMVAARTTSSGELLFSHDDIARLFRLVSDIADRRDLEPSQVIDRLEHALANLAGRVCLTDQDLSLFFGADD